jgi:hypothetical protein
MEPRHLPGERAQRGWAGQRPDENEPDDGTDPKPREGRNHQPRGAEITSASLKPEVLNSLPCIAAV